MDTLSRSFYELMFENKFLTLKGNAFQDFFSDIMEKCHGDDFIRVRPWGNIGDRKNDGYLKSQRILFQVYSPNELSASETILKIDEDFNGALPYWEQFFNTWVFVHNSKIGLGPEVTAKILTLERDHKNIKITNWGFVQIREKLFALKDVDIISILGHAPSLSSIQSLGFEDLKIVLLTIAEQNPKTDIDLRPVSPEKLKANQLSPDIEIMLKAGMRKADLVENFFNCWLDPSFGDRIAASFNEKYVELRESKIPPDLIFSELQKFAGGSHRGTAKIEAAILAVLAYLFERCDIFEPVTYEVSI